MPPTKKTLKPCGDETDRAKDFVLWCRAHRFHVTRVRVGDVEIDGLADLAAIGALPVGDGDGAATVDYRQQYGGRGLERLARDSGKADTMTLDDDD